MTWPTGIWPEYATDFIVHFSGPGRAIDPLCVSVCPDGNF